MEATAVPGSDPLAGLDDIKAIVEFVADEARTYFEALDRHSVRSPGSEEAAASFAGPLPEAGEGALASLQMLLEQGWDASIRSAGPRFFHWVTGGVTPAALGADWLATMLDQNPGAWMGSPLGSQLEVVALDWLKDLFGLPQEWGGVLTTGATMANFTGLAAARTWWAEQHGADVAGTGLSLLPAVPVFSSGHLHPSVRKALSMLGIGYSTPRTFAADDTGRLDAGALEVALKLLDGAPAIIVANAGEVNAGDFDPIEKMADLAERYGAWLHVDGAFGLFARVTPRTGSLVEGVERAHSVIADGHKWLNVPYDCGFAFVRDPSLLSKSFSATAAYLPERDDPHPNFGYIGPEMSRRARSLAVWATLRAYGRAGYRAMVERHLDLAQHLAARVDASDDLERLAEVPLNIVCFRFHPPGLDGGVLDRLNRRLGEAILADGQVYVGTTTYRGKVALRPAIVNWRTTAADIDLMVDVIRELGAAALADHPAG